MEKEPEHPLQTNTEHLETSDNAADNVTSSSSRKRQLFQIATLVFAAALILALIIIVEKPTDFESYVRSSGYVGVFLMGIIGSASPIWPLPGSWAAFIAGGIGLNPFILGFAAGLGEPIGETTFYVAGYGGQIAVTKRKGYAKLERLMIRRGPILIFLISAIPNNLIKLVVIAAGVLRYPWWKFFLLCWAGKTIKSFGFAIAGAGFFHVITNLIDRLI